MSNRIQHYICRFLQNSKLNREKFVKNKSIYKKSLKKVTVNKIIKRDMSSYCESGVFSGGNGGNGDNGDNGNNGGNELVYMFIMALGVYISSKCR